MAKKQLPIGDYMKAKKGGASYEDYANMAKAQDMIAVNKAEFEAGAKNDEQEPEGAEGGENGDDDGDEAEKARKSADVSADDLLKSIRDYDAVEAASTQAGGSRESYLKAKLDSDTITKSEMAELGRLWAGLQDNGPSELRKSMRDTIAEGNDDAGSLVDASEFLTGLVKSVDASLERVESEVARDGMATRTLLKAQGGLIKSLAQLVVKQDKVISALGGRLNVVETSPAPRRSVGNSGRQIERQLAKSATGGADGRDPNALSKSQVHVGLRTLMQKAADARDDQAIDAIAHETARYESSGQLSPNMTAAIRQVVH